MAKLALRWWVLKKRKFFFLLKPTNLAPQWPGILAIKSPKEPRQVLSTDIRVMEFSTYNNGTTISALGGDDC
jgi:hypothetical protein